MKNIGNASLLKDLNKSVILNTIKDNEPISRAEVVKYTKLALPTVLRNVNNLISNGLIVEVGKGDTSYGRKPIMLKINPLVGYLFGVRIGRRLVVIMTDFKGNILDQIIDFTNMKDGPLGVVKQIKEIIYKIIESKAIPLEKVAGIGVATPGSGFKTGTLISSSNFLGWETANFEKLLEENMDGITTLAEYNTICGIVGEQWFGELKQAKRCIYIYVDSGVGGGVIIDGKVYRGKDGYAGHIGHHVVNFEGEQCYCGNKGCLETYTSSIAIVRKVQAALQEGKESILNRQVNGDLLSINFNMIIDAYKNGDQLAIDIFTQAGKILGIGIANSINMYNPDLILLGGEVCCMCPLFVEEAIRVAMENTFSLKAKEVEILISKIEQYPEALGAVALVMNEIFKIPEI